MSTAKPPHTAPHMTIIMTIAVLFIFFVLLLFGIIAYAKFQQSALRERQEELLVNRGIEISTKVLFLPELVCTKGEAEAEDNCFDMAKVNWLNQNGYFEDNIDYYFDLFSFATISINQTYPLPENEGEGLIVLYDKQDPNKFNKKATHFVISLKDEVNDQFGYGFLTVEVYQ